MNNMTIDHLLNNHKIVSWWRENWSLIASVLTNTHKWIELGAMLTKNQALSKLITNHLSTDHK